MKKKKHLGMRRGESGFAVLLVFAMAATIALMLYMELPRVAFEAQRQREELLIQRGEAYKRAIQLYFRKFKTYPQSIDALENTNGIRFLRRRYPDPLTGKDDWRLIHIGPGGVFTDSLTNKPKGSQQPAANTNNFITESPSIAQDTSSSDQTLGPAFRRRPSEGGQPQTQPGDDPNAPPPDTNSTAGTDQPPVDSTNPQGNPQPGGPSAYGQSPSSPTQPMPGQQPTPGQQAGAPQNPVSAFPGIPGVPSNPGNPSGDPSSQPGPPTGNPNPFGQPGADPNQLGSNQQAADLIRGLLTQPRAMPTGQGMAGGMQIATGSIAGVASKVERRAIKIYNDRNKYNEWEFIYDFSKDRTGAGQLAGMMGAGQAQQPGQQQPGQPVTNTQGFGGLFGSGGSGSGFGSQPQQPSSGMQPGSIPPTSSPQQ